MSRFSKFIIAAGLFLTSCQSDARHISLTKVKAVFAQHDCCGRLPNTKITFAGDILRGGERFSIYSLNFINPESKHGMQRIAIIRNGTEFVGSYACDFGKAIVKSDRVLAVSDDDIAPAEIPFTKNGPPEKIWICGDITELWDSI